MKPIKISHQQEKGNELLINACGLVATLRMTYMMRSTLYLIDLCSFSPSWKHTYVGRFLEIKTLKNICHMHGYN